MKYQDHVPPYFSNFEKKEMEFESLDQILSEDKDTVAGRFSRSPEFIKFSFAKAPPRRNIPESDEMFGHLMADMTDGKFWVVGFITGTEEEIESLGLPEWTVKLNS